MSMPNLIAAAALGFALTTSAACSPEQAPAPAPSVSSPVLLPTPEPTEDESVNTGNDMYGFDEKVMTSSGLSIEITKIDPRRTKGAVYFTFRVRNEGRKTWDGSDANVMVFYDGMNEAAQISSADKGIGGTLAPGKSRTTTLGYKIPRSGFDEVTVQATLFLNTEGTVLYFDEIKA